MTDPVDVPVTYWSCRTLALGLPPCEHVFKIYGMHVLRWEKTPPILVVDYVDEDRDEYEQHTELSLFESLYYQIH
jgi:hypothetical protein